VTALVLCAARGGGQSLVAVQQCIVTYGCLRRRGACVFMLCGGCGLDGFPAFFPLAVSDAYHVGWRGCDDMLIGQVTCLCFGSCFVQQLQVLISL
jgi:hypothetical protein